MNNTFVKVLNQNPLFFKEFDSYFSSTILYMNDPNDIPIVFYHLNKQDGILFTKSIARLITEETYDHNHPDPAKTKEECLSFLRKVHRELRAKLKKEKRSNVTDERLLELKKKASDTCIIDHDMFSSDMVDLREVVVNSVCSYIGTNNDMQLAQSLATIKDIVDDVFNKHVNIITKASKNHLKYERTLAHKQRVDKYIITTKTTFQK